MRATALQRTRVLWGVLAAAVAMISVQSGAAGRRAVDDLRPA
jgi:hypothetical protein